MATKTTKTFTITTDEGTMRSIERFFALLHFNSRFGHSGIFGMSLDGDGDQSVTISPIDRTLAPAVGLIGGVGYDLEMICDHGYSGRFFDRERESRWVVQRSASLYRDGDLVKTYPQKERVKQDE